MKREKEEEEEVKKIVRQGIQTLLAAVILGLMSKYNFKLSMVSSFVNKCLPGDKDKTLHLT